VVKFDVARREVADNAARRKTGEASYVSRAQELLAQRKWAALGAHVKDWQAAVEGSGAAWYYMGMHERGQRRQLAAAKEAFEKAVALDPEHEEALYMLCVTLHELKYRSESAYCGRDLKGAARYESFVDQQFGNRLWTSNPAPALPGKIWLAKEKDGSTLITNIDQLIELRGLNGVNVPLERQQLPWHAR
jgi:hypothetical protein